MRSSCDLTPQDADHAGRILMMLLAGEPIEHLIDRKALENASDALIALGNDTDCINARRQFHVQLVKSTFAWSAREAAEIVLDAIRAGNADPHITVFEGENMDPVFEQ